MDMGARLVEWWDSAHENNDRQWLTGSDPAKALAHHRVSAAPPDRVLDVGVGLGLMAGHLGALGVEFDCLDISPVALARPEVDAARSRYFDAADLPPDEYDLIVHHFVALHMADAVFVPHLGHLIRSLKPRGLLTLQGGVSDAATPGEHRADYRASAKGGVVRSRERFEEMVVAAGGEMRDCWKAGETEWLFCHIGRRGE